MRDIVIVENMDEAETLKNFLCNKYPKDASYINSNIMSNIKYAPLYIYVYNDLNDKFCHGNRTEYDSISDSKYQPRAIPTHAYVDPEKYPEYFL